MPRRKGVVLDGALIRSERENRNWSREDLAKQTVLVAGPPGVTRKTIGNAEAGRAVSHETARLIALALEVPLIFLVEHDYKRTAERLANAGFRVPLPPPPEEWIERGDVTERVRSTLLSDRARVCLRGPAGSGRSTLAQHVLHCNRIHERYPHGVLWLSITPPLTLEQLVPLMLQIATVFDFEQYLPAPGSVELHVFAARFRHFLGKGRVLLALDEVSDDALAMQLLPDVERVGALMVSDSDSFGGQWRQESLIDLNAHEVAGMMRLLVSDHDRLSPSALAAAAQLTCGMPGCVRILATLLQEVPELSLERVVEQYRTKLMELQPATPPESLKRVDRRRAANELLRLVAPAKLLDPLQTLSIFGRQSFTRHWIQALFSVYASMLSDVLKEAPNMQSETHWTRSDLFKRSSWLDAQSHGIILAQAALIEARRLAALSPAQRWAEFNSCRGLWQRCWELLLSDPNASAHLDRETQALVVRQDPNARQTAGQPELVELVLAMRGLLIQGTVPEARDWLYAAYLSARGHQDPVAEGQLAEMIGRHCYPDYAEAFKWFEAGERALNPTGQCAHLASVLTELGKMHHGMSRWQEGLVALRRAYELSVEARVEPALLAVRANNLALGHLVMPNRGSRSLQQSSPLLQSAMLRMSGTRGMLRMVQEVARMNLLLSHWRQQAPLPAGTHDELDAFIEVVGPHSLYLSYPILSARWLGVPLKHASARIDCERLWHRALLGGRKDLDPVLRHVSCVVSNLRRLIQLQQDDTRAERGTLAIIDATASLPDLADTTGSVALCYIVEPFQSLFTSDFIKRLLRVLERGYGHYHAAFRNAAALYVEHQRGAPLSPKAQQRLHEKLDGCVEDASACVVTHAAKLN